MPSRLSPRARRRPLSLTSLIDVIFLLLLFFMLSTTFARHGEIPLEPAGAGGAADSPPVFLRLTAERLTLDTREVALADLAEALRAAGATRAVLAPQPDVTAQRLVDVLAVLRAVPGLSLAVLGG